jgi:uroporphyrinogen III methyltransferase/synthase
MTHVVLSTRPRGADDPLVPALEAIGLRCVAMPTVATEPQPAALGASLASLPDGAWVAVTSQAGANAVIDALGELHRDPATLRWAAIGDATAVPLKAAGATAVTVATDPRGTGLAAAIERGRGLVGVEILLARADAASNDLPDALRQRGATVREVVGYRTIVGPESSRIALREALADPELAAVVLASGSAVRGLLRLADPVALERLQTIAIVSIGPSTSAVIRAGGLEVAAEAAEPSVPALVAAVRSVLPIPVPVRPMP